MNLLKILEERLIRIKLRKQLNFVYMLGFFIPMACIGIFLIFNTSQLLLKDHLELNKSNNLRMKKVLLETTKQVYNISEEIATDEYLQNLLNKEYKNVEFMNIASLYDKIFNNFLNTYQEIEEITIYTDNMDMPDYKKFIKITDDIRDKAWLKKAQIQISAFWISQKITDKYEQDYNNLYLVRRIPTTNAVLVIKLDENTLKNILLDSNDVNLLLYLDNGELFFNSIKSWNHDDILKNQFKTKNINYQYEGQILVNDKNYIITISTLNLSTTYNRIYICTINNSAYNNIMKILTLCFIIIIIATILPFFLIRFYIIHFTRRVDTLREAMHRASQEDYNVSAQLMGEDEISEAFTDLLRMVEIIKEKDAKVYDNKINAQRLENAQQRVEMEVLASQINPHFLYNTLETIRMKAFKAGDRDVATAIKLLGKSMRYVLENTGTSSTTLKNELDYIGIYLQIQKLRFTDKLNYVFHIEEDMATEEYEILPLLVQPIVENAITHGLEDKEEGGLITIDVYISQNEFLHIDISDNGCGMELEALWELRKRIVTPHLNPNKSIGLYNINQRIRLLYGDKYGMMIESTPGRGTTVSLTLPITFNIDEI